MTALIDRLKDKSLLRTDSYVNGAWISGDRAFGVTNPADRSVIAEVADVGEAGARKAVDAAEQAFEKWKKTSVYQRARLIHKSHDLII